MSKIYVVNALDMDDDCHMDYIIGWCKTKEEAEAKCKELSEKDNEELTKWVKWCSKCECECESFKGKDDKDAIESFDKIHRRNCPFEKNLRIEEIFYGKDNTSGGFEIMCDNIMQQPWNYKYEVTAINELL